MGVHFREECKHGIVRGQCHCPDPNKEVRLVPCDARCKDTENKKQTNPSYISRQLRCELKQGGSEVWIIDTGDKVLAKLTLAAAEDLSHWLDIKAKEGRQRAADRTSDNA